MMASSDCNKNAAKVIFLLGVLCSTADAYFGAGVFHQNRKKCAYTKEPEVCYCTTDCDKKKWVDECENKANGVTIGCAAIRPYCFYMQAVARGKSGRAVAVFKKGCSDGITANTPRNDQIVGAGKIKSKAYRCTDFSQYTVPRWTHAPGNTWEWDFLRNHITNQDFAVRERSLYCLCEGDNCNMNFKNMGLDIPDTAEPLPPTVATPAPAPPPGVTTLATTTILTTTVVTTTTAVLEEGSTVINKPTSGGPDEEDVTFPSAPWHEKESTIAIERATDANDNTTLRTCNPEHPDEADCKPDAQKGRKGSAPGIKCTAGANFLPLTAMMVSAKYLSQYP